MHNHTDLLTKSELQSEEIITCPSGKEPTGWRGTTYDTCVGEIITRTGSFASETYSLPPRGIVWLLSAEDYKLPDNITGVTTLRTTWTKQGILTLTVGIVDPNYQGPLSTAVINFSGKNFNIQKGEVFFRTAFFKHAPSGTESYTISRDKYREGLIKDSSYFSESFLTIDTLAQEIAPKILGMPRWGLLTGIISLGVATIFAILGLVLPPLTNLAAEMTHRNDRLEDRIEKLEGEFNSQKEKLPNQINPNSEPIPDK